MLHQGGCLCVFEGGMRVAGGGGQMAAPKVADAHPERDD